MHFINGLRVETGGASFASENPATGEEIWRGFAAGEAEITAAVAAARAAFAQWATKPMVDRLDILQRFKGLVESRKDDLALLIAQETGKVLWDAKSEVAAVLSKITFTTDAYHERTGERHKTTPVGDAVLRHAPHGVFAVFGPYNFPAHLPNGHIMPALLAGNTIVFKPSELTPKVAEWVVGAWHEAGLPSGVLNLVQGEQRTGILLSQAPIDGILFTGSSRTGIAIHKQMAGRPEVILALEMGGNNPLIVGPVSDLRAAVHETLLSAYVGSGQRCTCARRLVVIDGPKTHAYIQMLCDAIKQLKVDSYDAVPAAFMGPLISNKEMDRLLAAQAMLEGLGGQVLVPMRPLRPGRPFLSPGLIDMTGIAGVPDEEYFGPVLQLYRVPDEQAAVAVANDTRYGLSAAVLCDDPALFQRLSKQIRAGLINWNRQTTGASGGAPFGGVGLSGNHRPAGYYAADYCAYPVASVEAGPLALPATLPDGMVIA